MTKPKSKSVKKDVSVNTTDSEEKQQAVETNSSEEKEKDVETSCSGDIEDTEDSKSSERKEQSVETNTSEEKQDTLESPVSQKDGETEEIRDSGDGEQAVDKSLSGENGELIGDLENGQPEHASSEKVASSSEEKENVVKDKFETVDVSELSNIAFEALDDTEVQLQETTEDDLSEYFIARTFNEMKSVIQEHSDKISATYCVQRRTKNFGKEPKDIDFKNHKITWNEPNLPSNFFKHDFFKFDGTPYMTVGKYYLYCQFGQDTAISRKARYKRMRESGEIVVSQQRIGAQEKTKKCGCPAVIGVKQVVKFPDYHQGEKVQRMKYYKGLINKKLRTDLDEKVDMKMECYYIGKLPHVSEHKFHELLLGSENQKESIHKDLKIMAQEMNFNELNIGEIHSKLQQHVLENWFYNKEPPDLSHRRYFPFKHDIRNMRNRILQLCEFTEGEIESLEEVIQQTQKQDPCSNIIFQMENIDENSMKNVDDDFSEPTPKKKKYDRKTHPPPPKNYKSFFFLHQSSKQQQLLLRYGSVVYITELKHTETAKRALTFRMFLLLVQTNVDFQVVGCFAFSKLKQAASLVDRLQRFRSSNMQWTPKHFIGDCSEEISRAVETVFTESEYFFSPSSCRKKWLEFIEIPCNELTQNSDDIITYMENMATAYTKEALTASATLMELSDVWNSSTALQNWFQSDWLLSAKRWVKAYRPEDLLMFNHGQKEFKETINLYEEIMSESTCLYAQSGFIKMVERIGNEASTEVYDRYVTLNHKLFAQHRQFSSLMANLQPMLGIPSCLLPIYEEIRQDLENFQFQIDIQQVGIFKVKQQNEAEDDSDSHVVVFGSNKNYPSCTCPKWHKDNVPCLHMFVIFKHLPGWKYDSLSIAYRMNPIFEIDYACLDPASIELMNKVDAESQTEEEACKKVDNESKEIAGFSRIFKSVQNIDCSETMIVKLKSFKNQMKDLSRLFQEKRFQNLLETDLDSLINELENKSLNSESSTLRQTPQRFVSLGRIMNPKLTSGHQKASKIEIFDKSKLIVLAKQCRSGKKVLAKRSTFDSHLKKPSDTN